MNITTSNPPSEGADRNTGNGNGSCGPQPTNTDGSCPFQSSAYRSFASGGKVVVQASTVVGGLRFGNRWDVVRGFETGAGGMRT